MNIEVGKEYKTMQGLTVIIEQEIKDEPVYKFKGRVTSHNGSVCRLGYWTRDGHYSIDHKTDFDIVM